MQKKFRSIGRAMRRGHITKEFNELTKSFDFFRKSSTGNKVFMFSQPMWH